MTYIRDSKVMLVALSAALLFIVATKQVKTLPRVTVNAEMQVVLPLFVQVFMAAGDRYLAANIASIRALVVDNFKMTSDEFAALAKLQDDVSWLNPGHEDNYYIATAILPWQGEVDITQRILARATKVRPFDYQPAFYYGFNLLHFKGDAEGASKWVREAAAHLPEGDERLQMENLGAIWLDRSHDLDYAINVVEAMASQAKRPDFKKYLRMRAARLVMLKDLRNAQTRYRHRFGENMASLNDLVIHGLIEKIPIDPFGFGFAIDKERGIVLRNTPALQEKKQ